MSLGKTKESYNWSFTKYLQEQVLIGLVSFHFMEKTCESRILATQLYQDYLVYCGLMNNRP